jgi:hypothetical protein
MHLRFCCAAIMASIAVLPHGAVAGQPCEKQTTALEQCKVVPGLINATAGSGTMLWVGNSRDAYQVAGDPELPEDLTRVLVRDLDAMIYGEFRVCPLAGPAVANRPRVCVASAQRVTVVPLRYHPLAR